MSDDHGHGGGHGEHGGGGHGGGHAPAPKKHDDKSASLGAIWKDVSPLFAIPMMLAVMAGFLILWLLVKPAKAILYFVVVIVLWHGGSYMVKQFYHLLWDPLPARKVS